MAAVAGLGTNGLTRPPPGIKLDNELAALTLKEPMSLAYTNAAAVVAAAPYRISPLLFPNRLMTAGAQLVAKSADALFVFC